MPREAGRIADTTAQAPRVVLFGRDHAHRGAVATAVAAGADVAVGLARGWRPKPYPAVDANEDAVAARVGDEAQLLVVADGHNGDAASHRAVEVALDALGDPPRAAGLTVGDLLDAAQRIERRVSGDVSGEVPRSRTTLVVALRTPTNVWWFAGGDSSLVVVDDDGARVLPARTSWFFGDHLAPITMRGTLAYGCGPLPPSAWVVLATDGYTDYLPDDLTTAEAVAAAVQEAGDARRAVVALLDQARRGGAGDNVGVALSGPWYTRADGHDDLHGGHR